MIEMINVEGGTLIYKNQNIVLDTFQIGKYPVTQKLWQEIMGYNPSYFKGENLPVEHIDWDDCQQFLQKLNEQYPGKNYRLPTHFEWRYAAKGGNRSKGYKYAGSNNLKKVGWFCNLSTTTVDVGLKQPNELGLYDMSGNVWEWCQDDKMQKSIYKTICGGAFYSLAYRCTINYTQMHWEGSSDYIGLRLTI